MFLLPRVAKTHPVRTVPYLPFPIPPVMLGAVGADGAEGATGRVGDSGSESRSGVGAEAGRSTFPAGAGRVGVVSSRFAGDCDGRCDGGFVR